MTGAYFSISDEYGANVNQAILENMHSNTPRGFVCMLVHKNNFTFSYGRHQFISNFNKPTMRRMLGGGTLAYRSGLLALSFIGSSEDSSIRTQSAVVSLALKSLGLPCVRTQHNDILLQNGTPLAINLFDKSGQVVRQQILLNLNVESTAQNMLPPPLALMGVGEDKLIQALIYALQSLYKTTEELPVNLFKTEQTKEQVQHFKSEAWLHNPPCPKSVKGNFAWGNVEFALTTKNALVEHCTIYTNALCAEFLQAVAQALKSCPYLLSALKDRVLSIPFANKNMQAVRDILQLLEDYMQQNN